MERPEVCKMSCVKQPGGPRDDKQTCPDVPEEPELPGNKAHRTTARVWSYPAAGARVCVSVPQKREHLLEPTPMSAGVHATPRRESSSAAVFTLASGGLCSRSACRCDNGGWWRCEQPFLGQKKTQSAPPAHTSISVELAACAVWTEFCF